MAGTNSRADPVREGAHGIGIVAAVLRERPARSYWYAPAMRGRLSIVAGLVVGVVAAGLLLGGILAVAPDGPDQASPTPWLPTASSAPSVPASAAPSASGAPSVPVVPCAERVERSVGPGVRGTVGDCQRFGRGGRCRVRDALIDATPAVVPHERAGSSAPGIGATEEVNAAGRGAIARIARLAARPGRLLVVADFDGTLAEGSRDPGAATIVPLARRALRRLARVAAARPDRVAIAILTGRTAGDVASRVRVGGITYLGDHGLQSGTFPRRGDPARIVTSFRAGHEASHEPAATLAERVPEVLGHPSWLFIERKGPSVAFHVRQADDRVAARAAVEAAIEAVDRELPAHDLAHYRGRLVVDLRPRTAGGKREAFETLLADLTPATVVAFGDDLSDADGFVVLRSARAAGRIDGLAVAVTGPHGMPDEVRSAADVHLGTPFLVARALAALATVLERGSG